MVIDKLHSLFFGFRTYNAKNRPKDFFLIDSHVRSDVIKQARAEEITVFVSLDNQASSIRDEVQVSEWSPGTSHNLTGYVLPDLAGQCDRSEFAVVETGEGPCPPEQEDPFRKRHPDHTDSSSIDSRHG